MSDRETVRQALIDAIISLDHSGIEGAESWVARYRKLLSKRYGSPLTPMEKAMEGSRLIALKDIPVTSSDKQ